MRLLFFVILAVVIALILSIATKSLNREAKENEKVKEQAPVIPSYVGVSTQELNAEIWKRQVDKYLRKRFQGELVSWRYSDEKLYRYAHTHSPFGVDMEMVNGEKVSMNINPTDVRLGYKPVILPAIKVEKPKVDIAKEWLIINAGLIEERVKKCCEEKKTCLEYPYGKTIEVDNEVYDLDEDVISSIIKNLNSNTEYEVSKGCDVLHIDFSIMAMGAPEM